MKTLIYKELRENLKLALPGFLLFTLVLVRVYQNSETQPLLSVAVLRPIEFFCFAIGVGLGWFQFQSERHRDLWAFLIHRPLTRTQIFGAKVAAGLSLYALAAGVPLAGLITASRIPGRFASPLEWQIALPVAGDFLFGIVWYFAGLLTGLRRTRWYASRGLPLLAALLISIVGPIQPSWFPGFWQQFVVLLVGGIILAVGAWGVFQGDGSHRSQPTWGKVATTGVLTMGVILMSLIFQAMIEVLSRGSHPASSRFEVSREGTVYEIIERTGKPAEIMDLAGTPVKDPTGHKMSLANFDKLVAESFAVSVDFGDQSKVRNLLRPSSRFYCLWENAERIDWYWSRDGRLVGYDTVTKLPVSSIEPAGLPADEARFLRPQSDIEPDENEGLAERSGPTTQTLATKHAIYEVNFEARTARRFCNIGADDEIGGARSIGNGDTIVVTRCSIEMIDVDGKVRWRIPNIANGRPYWVKVSRLDALNQFAVWVGDYQPINRRNSVRLRRYTEVSFVSMDGRMGKNVKLEPTDAKNRQAFQSWSYPVSSIFMPPMPILYKLLGWGWIPWKLIGISLGTAIVCALVGYQLGRRYHYELRTQAIWFLFHLLFGFPGLIAFFCVQEWPARERCTKCKRLRVVIRARCEYCDAEFAPPRRTGNEIFEPAEAN
jgi:hypothetical protein